MVINMAEGNYTDKTADFSSELLALIEKYEVRLEEDFDYCYCDGPCSCGAPNVRFYFRGPNIYLSMWELESILKKKIEKKEKEEKALKKALKKAKNKKKKEKNE
jgi:hypothetical protein